MTYELFYHCALQGDFFDPKPLLSILSNSELVVSDYNCRGEYGKTGRYKGKQYDFGYICIGSRSTNIDDFLSILLSKDIKPLLEMAEDREFHVLVEYTKQCNLEFSKSEIGKMHSLGLVLTVSCYRPESSELGRAEVNADEHCRSGVGSNRSK